MKYKIEFRRKQIVRIQAHLRRCAAICRYRPLIRGLIQVKQLIVLSDQLSSEINQLGDKLIKNRFQNDLQQIRSDVLRLHIQLKNDQLDDDSGAQRNKCKLNAQHAQRSQKVESLVKALQDRLQQVVQLLKQSMQQQQQLLEMQQKLEAEKQRLELEEQRRQQEQERLRKKEQLEERRKQQEARDQQQLCKSQVCIFEFNCTVQSE